MNIETIAGICHEANRQYCAALGDDSQPEWLDAPVWMRRSAIDGVRFLVLNPQATAADVHAAWLAHKQAEGWVYGPTKDSVLKLHPCMVPYDELPEFQRLKDKLFLAIVRALEQQP